MGTFSTVGTCNLTGKETSVTVKWAIKCRNNVGSYEIL